MVPVFWDTFGDGRLLIARLNRPKANVLDKAMIEALHVGLEQRIMSSTIAVLVSHEGPHFSFGASVAEHTAEEAPLMLKDFHGLFHYLDRTGIPLLCAVKGMCLGGGMELATFCHFLFAHPQATFGQPEIQLGVFPPMASIILNQKCPHAALDFNLTGRNFSGEAMAELGLITQLSETPEDAAIAFAGEHLLNKSASSLRLTTRANRLAMSRALREDLPHLERLYLEELMNTKDANEGINAFLEKRKPQWRNV